MKELTTPKNVPIKDFCLAPYSFWGVDEQPMINFYCAIWSDTSPPSTALSEEKTPRSTPTDEQEEARYAILL